MLISTAYAQATGGAAAPAAVDFMSFLPLILIFVVFYFLLIKPQQKKLKEHKAMVDALRRGDRIVTAGGLIGTVTRVTGDDEVTVEIAEGVRVRVVRSTISTVLAKTEPTKAEGDDAKK
ncbi:MAG: preprotein translocase subunit YajC [Rhodospirillaceae bacterium]